MKFLVLILLMFFYLNGCSNLQTNCGDPNNNTPPITNVSDNNTPPVVGPVEAPHTEPPIPTPVPTPTMPTPAPKLRNIEEITSIAEASECAKYNWKNRGVTGKGFIKGTALVFARAICNKDQSYVTIVSKADTNDDKKDALSWYNSNFAILGMSNGVSGLDTLRHAYTLLIGLAQRESSGRYCCGRDMSANFSSANSAEAGIYQASWGASSRNPELVKLFESYQSAPRQCFLSTFKEGFSACSEGNLKNWGTGKGFDWQKFTKDCPAFATEYAAILLRVHGGTGGEFGPLRNKSAELNASCNTMLRNVQELVLSDKKICDIL